MNLFKFGDITLHSGSTSNFKIDCDALSDEDIHAIAQLLAVRLPAFRHVEGVPTGGLRLAEAMKWMKGPAPVYWPPDKPMLLIVDDVLTTGQSMEEHRAGRPAIGAVIFARGECPDWVTPLFTLTNEKE